MRRAPIHWAARFIGLPWDPNDQHCWAFCRSVWAKHFGLIVPEVLINGNDLRATRRSFAQDPERSSWQATPEPLEGDAVAMAKGLRICHVGIWIEANGLQGLGQGGVLHSINPTSIFSTTSRLRDLGYRIDGFYRRVC